MRLSLKPIFSKLDALVLNKEVTVEEVKKFFSDNHKKVYSVSKANGAFNIEFIKDYSRVLCIKSIIFFCDGKCHYVLAEDSDILFDFYKPVRKCSKKNSEDIKNGSAIETKNKETYSCPSCGFISLVPVDKCPNCGITSEECSKEFEFTDVAVKLKKGKNMQKFDLDKIREESNSEAPTEVTAVYGDLVSVEKEEVNAEGDKTSNI